MFTIMTAFKPFQGAANIHQRNALASWIRACGNPEILVFGDVPGLAEVAQEMGLTVIPDFPKGDDGRIRVDETFRYAQKFGKFDRQFFINGDIVIMEDFAAALNAIRLPKFMMIGQRTDVDVTEQIDFSSGQSVRAARADLEGRGVLHLAWGLDYFAYTRGSIPELPPLYVGAAGWDNLMIFWCRRNRVPVVDASADVTIFHQNHENFGMRECSSAKSNLAVAQSIDKTWLFDATDASHWLSEGVLRTAAESRMRLARNISTLPIRRNWPQSVRRPFRGVAKITRYVGLLTALPSHP
jgi:hypothetical protein